MPSEQSLDKRIARLRSKRLTSDLFSWPTRPAVVRELSKNELRDKERGTRKRDIFKCVHNKHYFVPCCGCKRTQSDADKWLAFYEAKLAKAIKTK